MSNNELISQIATLHSTGDLKILADEARRRSTEKMIAGMTSQQVEQFIADVEAETRKIQAQQAEDEEFGKRLTMWTFIALFAVIVWAFAVS
jgi:hypothetical protein